MSEATRQSPLLELVGISKRFRRRGATDIVAVDAVSLSINRAEIVVLIGESGSGKSTLGRIALGLLEPDSGHVSLGGQRIDAMSRAELQGARRVIQPVFQDPTSSLNPRRSIRELLGQALRFRDCDPVGESIRILEEVGLSPGTQYLPRLPHELSGGQRQRVAVARALAVKPQIIIADEPLSGADVSVRGQLLNLFLDICENDHVAFLMITHDIGVARAFADRVAVMHDGVIVEFGLAGDVLATPQDPYTRRLISLEPRIRRRATKTITHTNPS
jgi:ABC-type glutathione transport system ATPase component